MRLNAFGALLAVNAVLVGALALLWSDTERVRWSEPRPLVPTLDDVAVAGTPEPVEISRYRETIERPLFAPNRRPAPRRQAEAEGGPPVDPFKDIRLVGVYGSEQGRGGLVVVSGGKLQRVAFGAKIGEWTVTGEEGRGASLVHISGERRRLPLALDTTAPASAEGGAPRAEAPALDEEGKAKAGQPARTPPAGPAPQRAPASRADAGRRAVPDNTTAEQKEQMEKRRRDRLERLNARRAKRGLPPLTE